jgi:hypothetical protein
MAESIVSVNRVSNKHLWYNHPAYQPLFNDAQLGLTQRWEINNGRPPEIASKHFEAALAVC